MPQNLEVEGTPEKTLLQIATENGIEIKSICKGVPSCAECRVKIVEGDSFITHPTKSELNLIGTSYYIDGRRLSCQVRCFGPVTVDVSEQLNHDQLKNKKIRGFKSDKQTESLAVQDTMLLTEKPVIDDKPTQEPRPQQAHQQQNQQRRPQHQNQNRNNNQNQQRRQNNTRPPVKK